MHPDITVERDSLGLILVPHSGVADRWLNLVFTSVSVDLDEDEMTVLASEAEDLGLVVEWRT